MTAPSTGIGTARALHPIGWMGLPMLVCIAATLVFSIPIRIFGLAIPQPVFPLAVAFAWPLIRPSVLPPFALLLLGLFLDAIWGGPQGLWSLCLLAAYAGVMGVRRMITGQDFIVVWAWYAAAVTVAFAVGYVAMIFNAGSAPSLIAGAWQYGATLLLFPLVHRLVQRYDDADVRFR